MITTEMLEFDKNHIWHPYTSMTKPLTPYGIERAEGVTLYCSDGKELIDGMSSWWSAIHGYNVPELNEALIEQSSKMNHVMFGGLTHEPAIELSKLLIEITPPDLQHIFLADSGSISVEVAMKMALQYHFNRGNSNKQTFASLRNGYHGDTIGAMSVCDPETGMHAMFGEIIQKQLFLPAPTTPFGKQLNSGDLNDLTNFFEDNHSQIAAFICEPIVQGAGGMRFYSAEYLQKAYELCKEFDILFIADEIATGFGRTGKLFACEHASITPDILCIGKALTGGQMTMAATLATSEVANIVCQNDAVLMHGPTFMANPLACAVSIASTKLLISSPWQNRISFIENHLAESLSVLSDHNGVSDIRILGAIGVIELSTPVDMKTIQPLFIEESIWVRPFGKLVYLMPPYIITKSELTKLTSGVISVIKKYLS